MDRMNAMPAEPTTVAYPALFTAHAAQFAHADALRVRIDAKKNLDAALWETIVKRLRVDWTYNSNGIEGSTLTRGETHFFLSEGLTVEGKPLKDFMDAQNHAEAIDMLFDVVSSKQAITEGFIKEVNALILRGVEFTPARNASGQMMRKPATPGQYKKLANHVEQADGTVHTYVEPVHVVDEMQALVAWINQSMGGVHPIHVAAVAHYHLVRIHPFDDGNGRGARILMNLILMHKGYFPAVVRLETKRRYLEALSAADRGDLSPFIAYIADCVITTQESVLEVLDRN
jgi:Fic family protein